MSLCLFIELWFKLAYAFGCCVILCGYMLANVFAVNNNVFVVILDISLVHTGPLNLMLAKSDHKNVIANSDGTSTHKP